MAGRHAAIVVCCCLANFLPAGMLMNTPGIFYPVIADDLGVQTVEISAWMALNMLSAALFQPLMGNVVARFKMRWMMLAGALVMAGVFLMFSVATAPWMFWAGGTITGICFATCMSVGPATLVNRWFHKHVGFLLGVCAACAALGGVVFMLLGQAVIEAQGWREAYVMYGVAILVVCVPAILLCIRDYPEDCGLAPYGAAPGYTSARETQGTVREGNDPEIMRRARACMKTPAFALLLLAGFLMNVVCMVNSYLPKFVYWIDDQAAVGAMSAAFVTGVVLSSVTQAGSAIGKLVLGAFSDFSVPKTFALLCGMGAVGMACVWLLPSTAFVAVGALVYGFFLSSVLVLLPMLVRAVFGGGELYPVLYARVAMAPALGGASANLLWPFIADNVGGFDMVFSLALVFIGVILLAGLTALRLPKGEWGQ